MKICVLEEKEKHYSVSDHDDVVCGIVSKKANTIDYSMPKPEIRKKEYSVLSEILSVPRTGIHFLDQEHKDRIITIKENSGTNEYCAGIADAMITDLPRQVLVIRTADCVPVLLFDGKKRIIGAVHSGWRSSFLGIAGKTVSEMKKLGANPVDIRAFILPSISAGNYQVGDDFKEKFPSSVSVRGGKVYLDLWDSVGRSLTGAGVPEGNILNSGICSFGDGRFFSHRRGDTGRTLNYIMFK